MSQSLNQHKQKSQPNNSNQAHQQVSLKNQKTKSESKAAVNAHDTTQASSSKMGFTTSQATAADFSNQSGSFYQPQLTANMMTSP